MRRRAMRWAVAARRLWPSRDGVVAIEFAFMAPVMILLCLGCVELSNYTSNLRKMGVLTRAIGELASQSETIDARGMSEIFRSAELILPPFDGAKAEIRLSAIGATSSGGAAKSVVCSAAATANAQPRSAGEDLSHLFADEEDGARFLYVEVAMPYAAMMLGDVFGGARDSAGLLRLTREAKWPVRKGVRKNSPYPEVLLPTGGWCRARGA